ncbi:MAG: hypothetical protein KJ067_14475 [Vicinamibacteria bacterium]|nr:hypothetical protein [Vicinamibacteria bacterium]
MSVVYFTDRDLGLQFPAILIAAGLHVERHRDHFVPDCPDEVWLAEIGRRRWVGLTHDGRIRYKPNERDAVIEHHVRLLVIVGKARFPDLAHSFVATRARVEAYLERNDGPFIARLVRASAADLAENPMAPGRVERWYPKS